MESISNGSHCSATPQVSAMAVHLYQYSGHHQQQYSRHHLSVMSNALEGSFPKCSVMQNRSRQLVPSSVDLSGYNPCDYVLSENLRPAMFSNHPKHGMPWQSVNDRMVYLLKKAHCLCFRLAGVELGIQAGVCNPRMRRHAVNAFALGHSE